MENDVCPECGCTTMSYDDEMDAMVCENCGYEESQTVFSNDSENTLAPEGCRACGGPYPNCITSCNVFED